MFQSIFIIFFLIYAIGGGIIQPQTVGLEKWHTEGKLPAIDGMNVTGKPSKLSPNILDELHTFISAILSNDFENGPIKRHIENDPETRQEETIEQKKWRTFVKLYEHIRLYGECKHFMHEMEQFFNDAIEKAKKMYGDSTKWFLTREIVDGIGTQKHWEDGQKICKKAMDSLAEAAQTKEYPGLVKNAEEKVHNYFEKLEKIVHEFMKEMERE